MSANSAPAAPNQPTLTVLPARASIWLCVLAGATLRADSGRMTVTTAPVMCGAVLLTHATPFTLGAGHGWTPPIDTGAAWVQVSNIGPGAAQLAMTAASPAVESPVARGLSTFLAGVTRWLKRDEKVRRIHGTTRC